MQGARLGLAEDTATGRFLGISYDMQEAVKPDEAAVLDAARAAIAAGRSVLVVDLPAPLLLRLADLPEAKSAAILDIATSDDALRGADCRRNVLHVAPSRAMLADALMQYLVTKEWRRIFLLTGRTPADRLYADALRRSAKKFQVKLAADREWSFNPAAQQADTGHYQINTEVADATGGVSYDVLVAADEAGGFADQLAYRTRDPRPIGGSAGLVAAIWTPLYDEYAATQLQLRFRKRAQRPMTSARLRFLAWGARRGRSRGARRQRRSGGAGGVPARAGLPARRLQGGGDVVPALGRPAAPADPAGRRALAGVDLAAARVPAPVQRPRHAGRRPAGDHMPSLIPACVAALLLAATPAWASRILVSNEKDNTITVLDGDTLQITGTVPVGARPRGILLSPDGKTLYICTSDADHIEALDLATMAISVLPSNPDPEFFAISHDGLRIYIANENDAEVSVLDLASKQITDQIPVGVEPEGMAVSPDDSAVVATSETTSMAHFIDVAKKEVVANVLVPSRPRYAAFSPDGKQVWVSSEVGGGIKVLDAATHQIIHSIGFEIPGVLADQIQSVGINLTSDGKLGFVCLGPANRVAVVDAQTFEVKKYLLVGQRVWHGALSPDGRFFYTANGISNDMSVIDVARLKVLKSVPVGQLPWGVVVAP